MGVKYTVTHYSFREPREISEYEYLNLKKNLQNNPDFSLIDKDETMTNEFSRPFKTFAGALIFLPIVSVIFYFEIENTITLIIAIIGSIWIIFAFMMFFMGLTDLITFASYLREKRNYFNTMEDSIRKSNNYDDFFDDFYI